MANVGLFPRFAIGRAISYQDVVLSSFELITPFALERRHLDSDSLPLSLSTMPSVSSSVALDG